MVLAKGSKVTIDGFTLKGKDYTGTLVEDYTVSLTSEFRKLFGDFQGNQAIDLIAATAKSLSGGRLGFSPQFKQLSTQVWDHTEPAQVTIGVAFDRILNANDEIMQVVKDLWALPLTGEGAGGNLIAPGPSPIEGIGLDALLGGITGTADTILL
jgi:hypothetical protein